MRVAIEADENYNADVPSAIETATTTATESDIERPRRPKGRLQYAPVKVLIRGGTLVQCDADGTVAEGDLLVDDGLIAALGRVPDPTSASSRRGLVRVLDARGCAVIPGFVQAHVHLCQVLFRGMADDMPLLDWLEQRIWPYEAAHDDASLSASAELGLLEISPAPPPSSIWGQYTLTTPSSTRASAPGSAPSAARR